MDKTIAGLMGAFGALALVAPAASATPVNAQQALGAASYADLFKPIPNAVELLKAVEASPAEEAPALVQDVQFHHHHHHHHHRYHHHHHHHRYYRHSRGPFVRVIP